MRLRSEFIYREPQNIGLRSEFIYREAQNMRL